MSSFQWGQWKPGNKGSRIFAQQLKNLNPCPDCKVSFRILPEKISRKMAESHEGINPKGRYQPIVWTLRFSRSGQEDLKRYISRDSEETYLEC